LRRHYSRAITSHPRTDLRCEEVREIPAAGIAIIVGRSARSSTTASAPIVDADTVDQSIAFRASRYNKSLDGAGDYHGRRRNHGSSTTFSDQHRSPRHDILDPTLPSQRHTTSLKVLNGLECVVEGLGAPSID
jgi:folate-dependent tRNA-U54 methylase TrmFO/GidA